MSDSVLQAVAAATALLIVAAGATVLYRTWKRRAQWQAELRQVESVAYESLRDIVLPDGNGGYLHLDFVLLTSRGLLVADLRRVRGTIFGSETMDEWVVMDGSRRHTLSNPLAPLYDRIAAVKQLAGEAPVEGRVVFTGGVQFAKGRPAGAMLLDSLSSEFPPAEREAGSAVAASFRQAWDAVSTAAVPSQLARQR